MSGNLLISGGLGFIASNYILHEWFAGEYTILNLDKGPKKSPAANYSNLKEIYSNEGFQRFDLDTGEEYRVLSGERYQLEEVDLAEVQDGWIEALNKDYRWAGAVLFASESHVDNSISNPVKVIENNVKCLTNSLEIIRRSRTPKIPIIVLETDEVYGDTAIDSTERFDEDSPLRPSNPYAASKAAQGLICMSYVRTYGMDIRRIRCTNNYGPRQYREKLVPKVIDLALRNQTIPIYGSGLQQRDWLHVDDHCQALMTILREGKTGVYCVGANNEKSNLEVVHRILDIMGKPKSLIEHVGDRLGHDLRYSLSAEKLKAELRWSPQVPFEEGLIRTVGWYLEND